MLTGGCLCGAVRYEAAGEPFGSSVCHCITCRRASGAPMVAWFSVKPGELRLVGETTDYPSSSHAVRRFCGQCGTHLVFDDSHFPDEVDIATATLDDPEAVPPLKHIWTRSQIAWVRLGDGLPRHPESSDEP